MTMRRAAARATTGVSLALGLVVCVAAAAPVGDEVAISQFTTSFQDDARVAALPGGGFAVAWTSDGSSGTDLDSSIQLRRIGPDGLPVGEEEQVNGFTTGYQGRPSVAVAPDGSMLVAWEGENVLEELDVIVRPYASDGTPLTDDFRFNSYTTGDQGSPRATFLDDAGVFVVVWSANDSPAGAGPTIRGRLGTLPTRDGDPDPLGAAGGEFQVSTYVPGNPERPEVAAFADGGFVVVWEGTGSTGDDMDNQAIHLRRFASTGAPADPEQLQVNTYTTMAQRRPAVETLADGGFVVVWQSNGSALADDSSYSIQARLYGSDGAAVGGEFEVNTVTSGDQAAPAVAALPERGFLVTWSSGSTSDADVFLQQVSADGALVGPELPVATTMEGAQRFPAVDADAEGRHLVAWTDQSVDSGDIRGQLLDLTLFADDFEDESVAAWGECVGVGCPPLSDLDAR